MNLTSGVGNVGIYSIENGNAKNYATIDVGSSDRDNKYYSIGMAAGYYNENIRRIEQTGTVENHRTINVNNDYGIGIYAVGNGSKAVNYGTINLDGKGNFKADLNFGIENQRFGVTLNAGYDTKGENMRSGIGFRAIY